MSKDCEQPLNLVCPALRAIKHWIHVKKWHYNKQKYPRGLWWSISIAEYKGIKLNQKDHVFKWIYGQDGVCSSPCWTVCGGLQQGWEASKEQTSDASEHSVKRETHKQFAFQSEWKISHTDILISIITWSIYLTNLRLKFPVQLWEKSCICFSPLLQYCNRTTTTVNLDCIP